MTLGAIRTMMIACIGCIALFIGMACWIGFSYTVAIWLTCFVITMLLFRQATQTAMPESEDVLTDDWQPPEVIDSTGTGSWVEPVEKGAPSDEYGLLTGKT